MRKPVKHIPSPAISFTCWVERPWLLKNSSSLISQKCVTGFFPSLFAPNTSTSFQNVSVGSVIVRYSTPGPLPQQNTSTTAPHQATLPGATAGHNTTRGAGASNSQHPSHKRHLHSGTKMIEMEMLGNYQNKLGLS